MTKKWSRQHYNAIAKDIRETFPTHHSGVIARYTVAQLALRFAYRFWQDYEQADEGMVFDPIKFLDACSPDPERWPLSELWEGYYVERNS